MDSYLPVKISDLLHGSRVEFSQIEVKASWDEKTTGPQMIATICAFANDDFLYQLKLVESRGTGLPKIRRAMRQNGSQPPRFDFDPQRTYFRVILPAHPEYQAILTMQDVASLKAVGELDEGLHRLEASFQAAPESALLARELVKEYLNRQDIYAAMSVNESFEAATSRKNAALIHLIAGGFWALGQAEEAKNWLDRLPELDSVQDTIEAAIYEKRVGRLEKAHHHFQKIGSEIFADVKALHEFAQVKMALAAKSKANVKKQLLTDAKNMLMRVVQMQAPQTRIAWAWHDLGHVMRALKLPLSEQQRAFEEAVRLLPGERRFQQSLHQIQSEKIDD